jgi:DNA repair exonuclease SbcCD ATPase subunit
MPASLISASIRGIRSYSPRTDREQVIEFMPLTLIVGSNGTGKTTIIESLRFIISGSEPPHSDSRRNFVHESQNDRNITSINSHEYACIELQFKDSNGHICQAKRVISQAGTTKSATPSVTSAYKVGSRGWVQVHRQDDWSKIIPKLFGLPNQALLNYVILCHQEENLWCMGESAVVKQIFDKIFGCEEYKKETKHIDDEIRNINKDQLLLQKDLDNLRDKILRKDEILQKISNLESELKKISVDSLSVTSDLEILIEKRDKMSKIVTDYELRLIEIDKLKQKVRELTERDAYHKRSLQTFSVKRPAPAAENVVRQQPAKKKPAPDPTATDLDSIVDDFNKMLSIIENMPGSDDLKRLKALVDATMRKVELVRDRFCSKKDEPPPEISRPEAVEEVESIEDQVRKFRETVEEDIRKNLSELEGIRSKIESLQGQCGDESKYRSAQNELKTIENELLTVRDQRSKMSGSKIQIEREISSLRQEFERYKKVNVMYSECLGKIACNKIILEDLEKLKVCFNDSIIKFHDQMILKINELLRRRWRVIYKGTDIESIELVDEEITRGKDKKSFNYYMAMRKSGRRMKMKEKSSAGQRALAAIILRMTLAELFVKDFAFIALDEPTANLDIANVQALAKSIGAFVKKRNRLGLNVQWIIITHDEQFLQALDEECSPYFYRIKMDPTDKCSNIVKIAYQEAGCIPKGTEKE